MGQKEGGEQEGTVRYGQVRSGHVRSGQVMSCQVRSGPVRSGPVRSGPVRSGQVRSRTYQSYSRQMFLLNMGLQRRAGNIFPEHRNSDSGQRNRCGSNKPSLKRSVQLQERSDLGHFPKQASRQASHRDGTWQMPTRHACNHAPLLSSCMGSWKAG